MSWLIGILNFMDLIPLKPLKPPILYGSNSLSPPCKFPCFIKKLLSTSFSLPQQNHSLTSDRIGIATRKKEPSINSLTTNTLPSCVRRRSRMMGSLPAMDLPLQYPAARRDDSVVDDYHGVRIVDPYRRITTAHAIYALLIATLCTQIQSKYHNSSPFDTHYGLMLLFLAALLLYAGASVYEVELCARESIYYPVAAYSRLLGCAISLVVCIFVLELVLLGWIVFSMWAAFFTKLAYDRFCLHNCLLIFGGFIISKWNNLVENLFRPTEDPALPITLPR